MTAAGDLTNPEISEGYPSIDGSEFTILFDSGTTSSGSFEYTGSAPDPKLKFWSAKAGPSFELFWMVDDSELATCGACVTTSFNLDCLLAAQNVFAGTWSTPYGKGLSNLTFYNSGVVPVPAAVWLFGSGLLGLVAMAKRRRTKA